MAVEWYLGASTHCLSGKPVCDAPTCWTIRADINSEAAAARHGLESLPAVCRILLSLRSLVIVAFIGMFGPQESHAISTVVRSRVDACFYTE